MNIIIIMFIFLIYIYIQIYITLETRIKDLKYDITRTNEEIELIKTEFEEETKWIYTANINFKT